MLLIHWSDLLTKEATRPSYVSRYLCIHGIWTALNKSAETCHGSRTISQMRSSETTISKYSTAVTNRPILIKLWALCGVEGGLSIPCTSWHLTDNGTPYFHLFQSVGVVTLVIKPIVQVPHGLSVGLYECSFHKANRPLFVIAS